jgi:hypothetical protein
MANCSTHRKEQSVATPTPVVFTSAALDQFKDKTIKDICPLKYYDGNHCAHFVGHVLKINASVLSITTCADVLASNTKYPDAAACIRAHELFNNCADLIQPNESGCFIFITLASNIGKDGTMGNIPDKHVGIYYQKNVWNYSNMAGKVLSEPVADFIKRVDGVYKGHTVVKYTSLPSNITFLSLAAIKAQIP